MKVTLLLAIIFLCSCCSFSSVEAMRRKRAVGLESCGNLSSIDCQIFAEIQSSKKNYCHRYFYNPHGFIEWHSCGVVSCGEGLETVEEDLSKPYPNCCEDCRLSEISHNHIL